MSSQECISQAACSASDRVRSGAFVCIDVRTPAEFREVHIVGSQNVPLADLMEQLPILQSEAAIRPIALVCRTGTRAAKAMDILKPSGLEHCFVLSGGINAWIAAGNPVNYGPKAISLERQVRIAAGSVVALGTLMAAVIHPAFLIVPGLAGAGLIVAGITDVCPMGMMLAKLPWNRSSCNSNG